MVRLRLTMYFVASTHWPSSTPNATNAILQNWRLR